MHGARTAQGLYFFLQRVVTVKSGTPFGFKLVDGWLAHVANPDAPPPQWRITQTKVPFTQISAKGALIYGGTVVRDGEYLYVCGGDSRPEARQAGVPKGLVLARVPADALGDFAQWRFYDRGAWQKDSRQGHAPVPRSEQRVFHHLAARPQSLRRRLLARHLG